MRNVLTFILLGLFAIHTSAQTFVNYTTANGLIHNSSYSVMVDADNKIFVGGFTA